MRATLLPLLLLAAIAVADPAKEILGRWYSSDGAAVEFLDDGSAILEKDDMALMLQWRIISGKRLFLEVRGVGHIGQIVRLTESELVTKDKAGKLETLTRTKPESASSLKSEPGASLTARERKSLTEQLIKGHLRIAIERYNLEFKRLPPINAAELRVSSARWRTLANPGRNVLNESAEVLLVALKHPDLSSPISESDWGFVNPTTNKDGDSWNKVPDSSDSADAREIVDAYGNTIVYIHKNAYGKGPFRITSQSGKEVDVVACKKPNGTYYNPTSFQLISVGANGTQDVDDGVPTKKSDDIMNFEPQARETR